ncbi:hypothetical protein EK904_006681 [Melospiza melodia maxima]|nr:hypothetical protein EK904_006681 [Melospiza melodia maxima]
MDRFPKVTIVPVQKFRTLRRKWIQLRHKLKQIMAVLLARHNRC